MEIRIPEIRFRIPVPSFQFSALPRSATPIVVLVVILSLALSTFSVATVLSAPRYATVGVPATVGFEGFVSGVSDGAHGLTFRVFDVATGGNPIWTETQSSVQVTNGLYSTVLGATTAFGSSTFNGDRWIEVSVDGGAGISPRTRVSSVPFALTADNSNRIAGGGTANMIALFEGACPSGWTEYAAAQGRVVVGVPTNGSLSGTVGTALTDLENRTHTHSFSATSSTVNGTEGQNGTGAWTYYTLGHSHTVSGTTGTASTSNVMPYIQLRYCKLNS